MIDEYLIYTDEIVGEIKNLQDIDRKDCWSLYEVETSFKYCSEELKREIEFINSLYHDRRRFLAWNCLPAYDDTPDEFRTFMNGCDTTTKWDVIHDRLEFLNDLYWKLRVLYGGYNYATKKVNVII